MKEVPKNDVPEIGGGSPPEVPGECIPLPLREDYPRFPTLPGPELPYTDPQ